MRLGRAAGLTDDEIDTCADPDPDLPDADRLLIRAADELHHDNRIGDATWAELAERYDEAQLIELCMVVGQYHLVAYTLRSAGVVLEDGYQGLPR